MPKLTVKIDPSLCIAAASCVGISPHLFRINEEGFAEIGPAGQSGYEYTADVSDRDATLIEEAVASCPTQAIQAERAE